VPQPPRQAKLAALDDRIYRCFRSGLREHGRSERVILAVTRAQNWWAVATLAALAVDRDRRRAWAHANAVLGAAWAAAKLISRTVKRPRPNLHDCRPARHKTDRESFPSTHTTTAFAAATALPPLLPRTPLILVAITTAAGRLLLGEHYPTDVAAGAILGITVAAPQARRGAS
jgi:undecaprenyl-diphosphatase